MKKYNIVEKAESIVDNQMKDYEGSDYIAEWLRQYNIVIREVVQCEEEELFGEESCVQQQDI
jgi:hypothetical protein